VSTGGFAVQGSSGSQVQKNFPTVGRVVRGALIEKEMPSDFSKKNALSLSLHSPDFTTASRVALAINTALFDHAAHTPDAGTIEVRLPEQYLGKIVEFVTLIENLNVTPDTSAKIVINERTGTVVMGSNVRISTIAIAHGNLSVQISESEEVSQPLPFARGRTEVTQESDIVVKEGKKPLFLVESGVSIGEVVKALNALGVPPRDLIAIFQALKAAGALQAELEII
jgi:flagellar P-ring protein precursor FlgI